MSDNETVILDFEKTIVDIEEKIQHLKMIAKDEDLDITKEIKRLEKHLQIIWPMFIKICRRGKKHK